MDDNSIVITFLTVVVILGNIYVALRAIALAMALESGCNWVCRTIGNDCVMRVLFGIATLCFILAILKVWSLVYVNIDWWMQQSPMFHTMSFAYLAENYGVPMLGYAVIVMIQSMTRCTTSVKYTRLQSKIKKGDHKVECE